MKKIFMILLLKSLFIHSLISQTLLQQIENAYNALDTVSYIENIILSYKENELKRIRETEDTMLELRGVYGNMNPIQRQNALDSVMERYNTIISTLSFREDLTKKKVWEEICIANGKAIAKVYLNITDSIQKCNIFDSLSRNFSKVAIERDYSMFISEIKDKPVYYVLNLIFEKQKQSDKQFFQPDTSKLAFNLISFDKRFQPTFYLFVGEGKFVGYDSFFPTFSKQVAKNVPKIYRKIMGKKPKYLLRCEQLEGGNTIWYVLNDRIYVYRIVQMKEYELEVYIKRFIL